MQRLKENTPNGPMIHADAPNGDGYTLCGYAYEGTCCDDDHGVTLVSRGKINCKTCLAIIRHCKAISGRVLA